MTPLALFQIVALMLLGFGAVGASLRRRNRNTRPVLA